METDPRLALRAWQLLRAATRARAVARSPIARVSAVLATFAALLGVALWLNLGGPTYPRVGSCLHRAAFDHITSAACSSPSANLIVLARFSGVDSNRCDPVAGTIAVVVEYPNEHGPFVLCAGSHHD